MAVTADQSAPYTAPKAITDVIERYRNRGLPSPINSDVLMRASVVSKSLIPRTVQSLETLDLIDSEGKPTPNLEGLRLAPEAEFKSRMAEWLKSTYSDVFSFVDPSTDSEVAIRDAFRGYKPVGQQDRMVTLFVGLCAAAGLMPEKSVAAPRTDQVRAMRRYGNPQPSKVVSAVGTATASRAARRYGNPQPSPSTTSDVPAPLAGLLATLPTWTIGWSKAKRDGFMTAFGSVLDFCIPIIESDPKEPNENGGA